MNGGDRPVTTWWQCSNDNCRYAVEAVSMEGQRCPKCRKEDWWHPPKHSIPEPALVKKTYGPTLTDRQRGVLLACQARERNRETPKSLAVAEALQVALLEIDWRRAKS